MKKIVLCLISLVVLTACTNESVFDGINESSNIDHVEQKSSGCPEGTYAVYYYNFEEFRFKRPALECNGGFWFCTTGGEWEIICVPYYHIRVASISGSDANVWAQELGNKQIEIHFPLELKDTEGYTSEDLTTFNVDEEYQIYEGVTLKIGDYSVTETEVELVVVVDIL